MILLEDTRQQASRHEEKHRWFEENGIEIRRTKLYVGDYTFPSMQEICIDTKKGLQEIYNDLVNQKQHIRFREEADRAFESGIKLIILIEEKEVKDFEGVKKWSNPRMHRYNKIAYMHRQGKWLNVPLPKKPPVDSLTLYKIMYTFGKKHNVEWEFCSPRDAGRRIIELLGGKQDG